ncbi:response regulator transcription factor [Clostridium sp. CAG:265]|uniref:response regulator transcription factor n=1 Tax=Clostridium sp. CAG:265 TaxID=1262787 RepID=UPI00033AA385|nr:response regulator transcription factor [Clostridium sp. CAG:265]CDB74431.1 two component transcriptional regulator LuxR family [Clostridium sp. CAG:265]
MGIKIVLADDDSLIRESFKIMLSYDEHIEVMNAFGDGMDAIEYCGREKVDIALLDVRMPRVNGIQATREIVKRSDTKVIILTTFDEDEYIGEAMKCGAKGYILKSSESSMILDTIKDIYLEDLMYKSIDWSDRDVFIEKIFQNKEELLNFTRKEKEIVKEIASGLTNKEIAKKLFISEGAVKRYINSILNKTGFARRIQIAMFYLNGTVV